MFDATLVGETEIRNAWGSAMNLLRMSASRGVQMGVSEGSQEARSRHTFKNRTGELEKNIVGVSFGWADGGNKFQGAIKATVPYASFVEYDTRPHTITVKRGTPWLHWEEPQGDHHFAKTVHHPGTKGQPFMGLGFYKCEAVMVREVEIGIASAQQALNR